MGNRKVFFALSALAFFLAACSSVGNSVVRQPMKGKVAEGKGVLLKIYSASHAKELDPDFDEVQKRLRESLYTKLVTSGLFARVVLNGDPADYSLEVKIFKANAVSGTARALVGVLAGRSEAKADVLLRNLSTDEVLADFEVLGESASHPFSTEGSLDDAIRQAADQIIMRIQ